MIHVVIPHFNAEHWLDANLSLLTLHAREKTEITVVNMSHPEILWGYGDSINIIPLDAGDAKGGEPLARALHLGVTSRGDCAITVLVDPDALIIRPDWTGELHRIFADPDIIAAGINPRSYAPEFADQCEWNWCAFRTQFWLDKIGNFQWNRIDIGHLFRDTANL